MYGWTSETRISLWRCGPKVSPMKGNVPAISTSNVAVNSGLRLRRPVTPSKKMRCAKAAVPRLKTTSTKEVDHAPAYAAICSMKGRCHCEAASGNQGKPPKIIPRNHSSITQRPARPSIAKTRTNT